MTETPRDPHAADAARPATEGLSAQLSAFVDDQLPRAEAGLFVRQLLRDKSLQRTMSRYALIGEALRQPAAPQARVSRDFSSRVAAALVSDAAAVNASLDTVAKVANGRWQSLWKNVAGVGVAASVVASVWLVTRHSSEQQNPAMAAVPVSHATLDNSYVVPVAASSPVAPLPAARLTNYVLAHSEYSPALGRQNLMTGLLSEEAASGAAALQVANAASSASISH